MENDLDTRVSADLHPGVVGHLDGYDDDAASVLARTETAFANAYRTLIRVNDACEAARSDPTMTPAAALVKGQAFADQAFTTLAAGFDGAAENLKVIIAGIEQEFAVPIESRAGTMMSTEIRAYIANLPDEKRNDFVMRAIKDDDQRVITAVLGAPAILSGLNPKMMPSLTRLYHEHHSPLQAKRLRAAKAGLDLLGQRSGLIHSNLSRAVGADRATVEKHRAAAARTAKAFGA